MTMQWYIDVFETLFLLGDGVKHMFPLQHHLHQVLTPSAYILPVVHKKWNYLNVISLGDPYGQRIKSGNFFIKELDMHIYKSKTSKLSFTLE